MRAHGGAARAPFTEDLFRLLVEQVEDYAIFMLDPRGHVTTWNAGAERIKQYAANDVLGRHFSVFYTPEDRARGKPEQELRTAVREGRCEDEGERVRKDGSRFIANVIITAIRDSSGELVGFAKVTRDVTERKQAERNARRLVAEQAARAEAQRSERAIRASEEWYRRIVETAGEGIFVVDARGRLTFANPQLAAMLDERPESLVGRPLTDFVHPEGEGALVERAERSARDVRLQGATGREIWALMRTTPILDAGGRHDGALGMLTDVTDRRRAESALRALVEASSLVATSFDYERTLASLARFLVPRFGDWCAVDVVEGGAPRLLAVAHVDPEMAAIGRSLRERWPLTLGDAEGIAKVLRTGRAEVWPDLTDEMLAAMATDPEQRSALRALGMRSAMVVPLNARGRTLGALTLVSTSARRYEPADARLIEEVAARAALAIDFARVHRDLERQNDRLRILAEAGAALAGSLDYRATLRNLARSSVPTLGDVCVVDVLGEERDDRFVAHVEAGKDSMGWQAVPHAPASRGSGRASLYRTLDEASGGDRERVALLRQLGATSAVLVSLVARGGVVGTLSFGRGAGSGYEEEDLSIIEELARRAAVAVDNAQLFRQAENAVAMRDEFLAIASHELNTPLTPLKLQLESVRRGAPSPERVAAKLDASLRQVDRIAKLVSQLLDVSRITTGRLRLTLEDVDLAAVTRDVIARMDEEAQRAGSAIDLDTPASVVGRWDRLRVDQIVVNLLANAIKYGGGGPIAVSVRGHGDTAKLVVKDSGIGIEPQHQARIFQRFERAVSTRHYGGFGLGLWIVRQIVDASGGSISVDSVLGSGSTFTVTLPTKAKGGEGA